MTHRYMLVAVLAVMFSLAITMVSWATGEEIRTLDFVIGGFIASLATGQIIGGRHD